MQIMPGTAKDNNVKNVFDPKENVYAGVKILARHYNNFDQNPVTALAAYNSGGGTVNSYLTGTPLKVTQPDGTIKIVNPKGIKTTDGVPPYEETQKYVYGKDDGKGNMVGGYDPNAVYDVAALKAALPASKTDTAPVAKPDPIAVAQAKIDKMPAYDRSKDQKVDGLGTLNPDRDEMGVANWRDPNPPRRPDPVLVGPAAARPAAEFNAAKDSQAANVAAPQTGAAANMAKDPAQRAQALAAPATVVKPAPAPAPVVKTEPAPVVKASPAPAPAPVVKPEPAPPKPVVAPAPAPAPAVDQTGGAGKVGPTIAALKGTDINNPLNKGSATAPAPVVKAEPATAPAPTGDWKSLASANKITDPNLIKPGQELKLPGDLKYTVSKGDTLSGIASGNYKGTAPITPAPSPPPEITTDRLKALSGNATSLPSTLGPSPTIDLLNKGVNGKTSSADLVPDIKTAQADTDADDLEKMAVAENSKTINTRRYSFLLGL
jgi:LysM repeat protein